MRGSCFRGGWGPVHVDLWEANRRQLVEAGVSAEKIVVVGECTACAGVDGGRTEIFFASRRARIDGTDDECGGDCGRLNGRRLEVSGRLGGWRSRAPGRLRRY